jgi:tetratricopeptide (TPR) repeat protein
MSEALEKEPLEPELYLFLGALHEEMGSYEKAVLTFKKGLELQSDSVRLHFRLAVVYDKSGDKNACIEEMKAVIDLDPTHAEALNYLGYTYAELGINLDEAKVLIKRAMKHKPNDGYIIDSLGWVYYKLGLYKMAIKYLEEANTLAPDDATILEHLGDAHMKVNNPKKSLQYYKKSLEKKGEDTKALEQKIQSIEKQLAQDA